MFLIMSGLFNTFFKDTPKPENKDSIIFHKDYKPLRTQTINSHLLSKKIQQTLMFTGFQRSS